MNAKEKRAAYKEWREAQPVLDTPVDCLMCNGDGWLDGVCDCCGGDINEPCNFCNKGKTTAPMLSYNAWCLQREKDKVKLQMWKQSQEKPHEETNKER